MFLILFLLVALAETCIRTSEVSTTSTSSTSSSSSTSSTTSATTTTTTTASCTACLASSVTPEPNPDDPVNGHLPQQPYIMGTDAATGCSTLTIQCFPINGNGASELTFFYMGMDTGDPPNSPGDPASGTLICNSMGQWTFTGNGVTLPIDAAQCLG